MAEWRGVEAKRRGTKARQKRALNLERQMKVRVLKYLIPRTEKKITEVELTKTKTWSGRSKHWQCSVPSAWTLCLEMNPLRKYLQQRVSINTVACPYLDTDSRQ